MDIQRVHKVSSMKPMAEVGKSNQQTTTKQFQTVLDRQLVSNSPSTPATSLPTQYQIRTGDTLSEIVKQQLDSLGIDYSTAQLYKHVNRVAAANGIKNPNIIFIGQRIDLSSLQSGSQSHPSVSSASPSMPSTKNETVSSLPRNTNHHASSENHGHVHLTSFSPMPSFRHSSSDQESELPANGVLTSGFGMRNDPFTGEPRFHNGLDIAVPTGTPVVSIAPGEVVFAGRRGGYGNVIEVEHPNGDRSIYAHLGSFDVSLGQMVSRGEALGISGNTGRSTGPHLHFEIRRDGEPIDPMEVIPVDTLPVGVEPAREEFGVS